MNNVKVIHLDGQEFSMESGSDSDIETIDINKEQNKVGNAAPAAAPAATPADDDDDAASDTSDGSDSTASTASTAQLLASDPLYYILSRLFMTPGGKNLATILDEINVKLEKLEKLMPSQSTP